MREEKKIKKIIRHAKFRLAKGVSGICLETLGVYIEDHQFRN